MSLANHITPVYHEEMGWSVISKMQRDQIVMHTIEDDPRRYYANADRSEFVEWNGLKAPTPVIGGRVCDPCDTVFFLSAGSLMPAKYLYGSNMECTIGYGENVENTITLPVTEVARFV